MNDAEQIAILFLSNDTDNVELAKTLMKSQHINKHSVYRAQFRILVERITILLIKYKICAFQFYNKFHSIWRMQALCNRTKNEISDTGLSEYHMYHPKYSDRLRLAIAAQLK